LTYKIRPIEKQLPSKGELATRAEADIVQFFAEAFGQRKTEPADLSLARRLLTHPDAERIVAGLVRDHLGAKETQGANVQEEAAESRRARNPAPIHAVVEGTPPRTLREGLKPSDKPTDRAAAKPADRPRERDRDAGRDRDRDRPRDRDRSRDRAGPRHGVPQAELASWEPRAEADDDRPILDAKANGTDPAHADEKRGRSRANDIALPGITIEGDEATVAIKGSDLAALLPDLPAETLAQVYVSVGRRDGIRPSDIEDLFAESAQIEKSAILAIRVRDRATFVSLRKEDVENAVTRLHGISYRGKNLVVERAREHGTKG